VNFILDFSLKSSILKTMSEYQDWIEQDEEDTEMQQQQRRPLAVPSDPANRKSVVIHDAAGGATGEIPRSTSQYSYKEGGTSLSRAPSQPGEIRESRLFPGMKVQSREDKLQAVKKEEVVVRETKIPWAILAVIFLLGGLVMVVVGGVCIQQSFEAGNLSAFDACGPAGGGGGIVNLMAGLIIFVLAIWQLYRLKDVRLKFVKVLITECEGIPADQQHFTLGGKDIEENESILPLSSYNIKHFSTLHLVLKL